MKKAAKPKRTYGCLESWLVAKVACQIFHSARKRVFHQALFYYWIKKLRMEALKSLVSNDIVAALYKQDGVPLHIIEDNPVATSTQNVPAIVLHMG